MNIQEYKKQFIELYKKLRSEHGSPVRVYINAEDIYDDFGNTVGGDPRCDISF